MKFHIFFCSFSLSTFTSFLMSSCFFIHGCFNNHSCGPILQLKASSFPKLFGWYYAWDDCFRMICPKNIFSMHTTLSNWEQRNCFTQFHTSYTLTIAHAHSCTHPLVQNRRETRFPAFLERWKSRVSSVVPSCLLSRCSRITQTNDQL